MEQTNPEAGNGSDGVAEPKPVERAKSAGHEPGAVGLVQVINVLADRIDPLIRLLETWSERSLRSQQADAKHSRIMAAVAAGVVLVVVLTAGMLTYAEKIDGSTFTFLLGLVVGYVLTFIRESITGQADPT